MTKPHIHCAVYTRKSSEEGLEQSFNSLEAQREACIAYISSQKHEGWVLAKDHYDDGGFSGGSMERPALQRLLSDISAGNVQTVIVYKVDRLTRSLADFAKIIEVFDSHNASFVSVTQQFNTTTSMGRLTLNVLLSFAQFERELTGERIRDKVAASKKKGMWMGGVVPLGYDCVDHRLIINQPEAETVREIFRAIPSARLRQEAQRLSGPKGDPQQDSHQQRWANFRGCDILTGSPLSSAEQSLLHRRDRPSEASLIPANTKQSCRENCGTRSQPRLEANNQAHRSKKSLSTPSLLSGIVFDPKGVRFTPTHAVKNGKRYRYYTSQAAIQRTGKGPVVTRFPAQELESLVTSQIRLLLESPDKCTAGLENSPEIDLAAERALDVSKRWPQVQISKQHEFVRSVVKRVVVGQTTVWIEVDRQKLVETLLGHKPEFNAAADVQKPNTIKLTADFQPLRRGGELRLVAPKSSSSEGTPIPSLVKAVARARDWYERIVSGEVGTVGQLAQETGLPSTYIKRILACALLSPQMTEIILSGKHRPNLTLRDLLQNGRIDWRESQVEKTENSSKEALARTPTI